MINITNKVKSWGCYGHSSAQVYREFGWQPTKLINMKSARESMLAFGLGRSYGDSCLNENGVLLGTRKLSNLISFDRSTGLIRAEAGLSIADLHKVTVPAGWFVPVTPGTQFVTLGGAVANDIHGKNHHKSGTFGRHITSFALLRSDNNIYECSAIKNTELFNATIAGLGLTGLILWVEVQLIPIKSSYMKVQNLAFYGLNEFLHISQESKDKFDYTVAWLDCTSSGKNFTRGIFMRGNHSDHVKEKKVAKNSILSFPFDLPDFFLNRHTVGLFNNAYFWWNARKNQKNYTHYQPFFYPLDSVKNWNRLYGSKGFFQFQCVLPKADALQGIAEILKLAVASGQASFLAVLKEFGDLQSPGLLSFPRAGTTLCLDFPMRGAETLKLLGELESIVVQANGALYPAKDALMQTNSFIKAYPRISEFVRYKDPDFSSSFWRRVMES